MFARRFRSNHLKSSQMLKCSLPPMYATSQAGSRKLKYLKNLHSKNNIHFNFALFILEFRHGKNDEHRSHLMLFASVSQL